MATRQKAKFLNQVLKSERKLIDGMLLAEKQARAEQPNRQVEQQPFFEVEVKEVRRYGEELEERKLNDIFADPSKK